MQNSIEAATKPSMKRVRCRVCSSPRSSVCTGVFSRMRIRRSQSPSWTKRFSTSTSEPAIPPINSEPNTMSMGAESPTSAASAGLVTFHAESSPMRIVMRPSASVTVALVRSGRRCPTARPIPAPTTIVTMFATVPNPINICSLSLFD